MSRSPFFPSCLHYFVLCILRMNQGRSITGTTCKSIQSPQCTFEKRSIDQGRSTSPFFLCSLIRRVYLREPGTVYIWIHFREKKYQFSGQFLPLSSFFFSFFLAPPCPIPPRPAPSDWLRCPMFNDSSRKRRNVYSWFVWR